MSGYICTNKHKWHIGLNTDILLCVVQTLSRAMSCKATVERSDQNQDEARRLATDDAGEIARLFLVVRKIEATLHMSTRGLPVPRRRRGDVGRTESVDEPWRQATSHGIGGIDEGTSLSEALDAIVSRRSRDELHQFSRMHEPSRTVQRRCQLAALRHG